MSRPGENGYLIPESFWPSINSDNNVVSENTPYIAPDESYILFAVNDFRNNPYNDLYISFKKQDGTWCTAINMGNRVNTPSHELYPVVSPDGKYLFFLSSRTGMSFPYWMDAGIIEELKPDEFK